MTHYPTFVYALSNGNGSVKHVHLVPHDDQEERVGITVSLPCDPYDGYGVLRPEVRRALLKIGRLELLRSGCPVCVVFGPNDCTYLKEDGCLDSDSPPPFDRALEEDECDPHLVAEIREEVKRKEIDIGGRPILPAKRNELVF